MKTAERDEARRLRQLGRSVREIAALTGCARSSISRWVRDIPLTEVQRERLALRDPRFNGQLNGSATLAAKALELRKRFQEDGKRRLRRGDCSYAVGCGLYWAEGARDRNALRFTNSDPEMIRYWLRFLRDHFAVPDHKIRIACNIHGDLERQRELEEYWLAVAGLPEHCLLASTVNRFSRYSARKRIQKLPYGTCRVVVNDTRIVQTIYGSIQALGGFSRDAWAA